MKFFISAFIAGILFGLLLFPPHIGFAFYPEFSSPIAALENIEPALVSDAAYPAFSVRKENELYRLKKDGSIADMTKLNGPAGISGNGDYFIRYEKTGSEVEFCGHGQRLWKQRSREYPYLSWSGRLIFMLNGDQSAVRILDINGSEIGIRTITGRLCTSIAFSTHGDFGAVGFLDGSFTAVDSEGKILISGKAENGGMVKGLALSSSGTFAAVHSGNTNKDFIELYDIAGGNKTLCPLENVHSSKTAMHVSDKGIAAVLDKSSLVLINTKGVYRSILIDEKKNGQAAVTESMGIWFAAYTTAHGLSKFMAADDYGRIIYSVDFPEEAFLDAAADGEVIFLRGSDNLYCYSFHLQAE